MNSRVHTQDQIIAEKDKVLGDYQNRLSKGLMDVDGSKLKLVGGDEVSREECIDDGKAHMKVRDIPNPIDESDVSEQEHDAPNSTEPAAPEDKKSWRAKRRRKRAGHSKKKVDPSHSNNGEGSSSATSVPEQATASSEGPGAGQKPTRQDEQPARAPKFSLPPANPVSTPSLVPASGPTANIPTPSTKPICMD